MPYSADPAGDYQHWLDDADHSLKARDIAYLEDHPELASVLPCYLCEQPIGNAEYVVNEDAIVRHRFTDTCGRLLAQREPEAVHPLAAVSSITGPADCKHPEVADEPNVAWCRKCGSAVTKTDDLAANWEALRKANARAHHSTRMFGLVAVYAAFLTIVEVLRWLPK